MDFNSLYLFVGPPMTRGPPAVPLPQLYIPPPPPPPPPASPVSPYPPLPRPPTSRSKKQLKQRLRPKPYRHLKPIQRQVSWHAKPSITYPSVCTSEPESQIQAEMVSTRSETMLPFDRAGDGGGADERSSNSNIGDHSSDCDGGSAWLHWAPDQVELRGKVDSFVDLNNEGFQREMRRKMSELDHEYWAAKAEWSSPSAPGDAPSIWATVLEVSPQPVALDPIMHSGYLY